MDEDKELDEIEIEAERIARREARREVMRKQKLLQSIIRKAELVIIVLVVGLGLFFGIKAIAKAVSENAAAQKEKDLAKAQALIDSNKPAVETITEPVEDEAEEESYVDAEFGPYKEQYSEEKDVFYNGYEVTGIESASYPSEDEVYSTYAILVDMDDGHVIAAKDATTRINPASMTKILTILVAAEHVTNLDDTFRIDPAITSFVWNNDCSAVGFSNDEIVTVRDLMYGTILPSGGDAAMALAEYVAGSEDRFVVLMNEKLEELGLSDTTHFTNCVGIYNENHYSTMRDMAMIMKAAVENELARSVLTEHTYTTSVTPEHEEGITISNWFLRRIEDKDTHGRVECAKTGFVNQSGCCAASYQIGNDGKHYICVTADTWSSWRCIYDHVAIYDAFVPQ